MKVFALLIIFFLAVSSASWAGCPPDTYEVKNFYELNDGEVATVQKLIDAGADTLAATRLAIGYPEIAKKILNLQSKGRLEWMVLYRGQTGAIQDFDPFYFRVIAPPFRIGLNIGLDASNDFKPQSLTRS